MVTMQAPGTKRGLEASVGKGVLAYSGPAEYEAATGDREPISKRAIDYEGESAIVNPAQMTVDVPYPFMFSGYSLVAVKRADMAIDFFYIPSEPIAPQ